MPSLKINLNNIGINNIIANHAQPKNQDEPIKHKTYESEADFIESVKKIDDYQYLSEEKIKNAYTIYKHMKDQKDIVVVIGRIYKPENGDTVNNSNPINIKKPYELESIGIDKKMRENIRTISFSTPGEEIGGILNVTDSEWNNLVNDSFICGAIHGEHDIHICSERKDENFFKYNKEKNIDELSVFARELIGIIGSGLFNIVKDPGMDEAAQYNKLSDKTFSLEDYNLLRESYKKLTRSEVTEQLGKCARSEFSPTPVDSPFFPVRSRAVSAVFTTTHSPGVFVEEGYLFNFGNSPILGSPLSNFR